MGLLSRLDLFAHAQVQRARIAYFRVEGLGFRVFRCRVWGVGPKKAREALTVGMWLSGSQAWRPGDLVSRLQAEL